MEHESSTAHLARIFLGLAIIGTVAPLATILPWFLQNGLDLPRFVQELFSNRVSAFFAWDVIISAVAVLAAAWLAPGLTSVHRLLVSLGTLLVGVSCGLPLLLVFWTRRGVLR